MPDSASGHNLFIIADDFTGANDAGLQLAKKSAPVKVLFSWDCATQSDEHRVLVINTDSRAVSAEQAAKRVGQAMAAYGKFSDSGYLYKKIDSTLRGNLGAEIEAILTSGYASFAIVAPALPALGRTTVDGCCYINGISLMETEFVSDPKTPVISASIKACLKQQTSLPIAEISLAQLRSGNFIETLNQLIAEQISIVVVDAVAESDLKLIGLSLKHLNTKPLLVGSAGLINQIPFIPNIDTVNGENDKNCTGPALIIAGSMSEITQQQINYVQQRNLADLVDIEVDSLLSSSSDWLIKSYAEQVLTIINQQRHCIVRTAPHPQQRERITDLCHQYQLTRTELGERVSEFFGQLTALILSQIGVGGVMLTGGDIAISTANALGSSGFLIKGEVAPCIPYGSLLTSSIGQTPVITKAGGFGSEAALAEVLLFIEERCGG
ncbi:D-threonate kinase [Budvicia aquatica]|uniref:Four-carbon acid sugar kinase family protein n=3 Tax=Budvicia aquatica TaxID=82979 RepID=A0A2C6DW22_9GAMM|nr:four-carbon acid sugar kinase family protein [Budvicia aquatica]PHI32532.1 hypothetical protein CRN84_26080 [Budvicia aquatica]